MTESTDEFSEASIIYRVYREARMNYLYNTKRLVQVARWNGCIDALIAILSLSSASSFFFHFPLSVSLLGFGAAALVAVRRVARFDVQAAALSKLQWSYLAIFHDMQEAVDDVKRHQGITDRAMKITETSGKRLAETERNDENAENKRILKDSYAQVMREIPVDSLWYPSEPRQRTAQEVVSAA